MGVGYSDVGRNTGRSERHHAAQAAIRALNDAGLTAKNVDGATTWGGDAIDFAWMLGFAKLTWSLNVGLAPAFLAPAFLAPAFLGPAFLGPAFLGPAYLGPAYHAVQAVAMGHADTVMAFRIMMQQPPTTALATGAAHLGDPSASDTQFRYPFGEFSPTQWAGLMMQRYMHETGATEEHFAAFAEVQRDYALMNPDALQREKFTAADYLALPSITKPLRIVDCDLPCDSGSAVIFTTEERARDLKQPAVFVEAAAISALHDMNFSILPDMVRTSPHHCAELLWARTDLTPADIDTAHLYDGFSIITLQWLEGLGLCGPGEAGDFVKEGNTRLGGRLPTNTDGGAINVGRRHGENFCIEAARQLRGQCGLRQVDGAEVSVWANAVGMFSGAMLLSKG